MSESDDKSFGILYRYKLVQPTQSVAQLKEIAAGKQAQQQAITKENAIKIAKAYAKKESPGLDLSQKPPTAEFVANSPAHGGAIWVIGFAYPTPKDPKTGKIIGVRPFIGYTVWVRPDGSVEGAVSHTP